MKSGKTIVIVGSVVFLAVCLGAYSAERETQPSEPARAARSPARPGAAIEEEEGPIPKPPAPIPNQADRPVRTTPARRPPTRPSARPGAAQPTPVRRVREAEDPYKNSVILVEAFMVQVRLSALRSLDVPAISEGNDYVTADHIIKLMKTTDAAVLTAGAKAAVSQNSKAVTKSSTQRPFLTGPPEKKRTEYVEVGTQFMAAAEVRRDDKIFAELEFEHSAIEEGDGKTNRGIIEEWKFSSSIPLQDGKPTLVGASQDKETGMFLIVTANIQE